MEKEKHFDRQEDRHSKKTKTKKNNCMFLYGNIHSVLGVHLQTQSLLSRTSCDQIIFCIKISITT